jgi:hypothetical protein
MTYFDPQDCRKAIAAAGFVPTPTPLGFRHPDGRRGRMTTNPRGDWYLKVSS